MRTVKEILDNPQTPMSRSEINKTIAFKKVMEKNSEAAMVEIRESVEKPKSDARASDNLMKKAEEIIIKKQMNISKENETFEQKKQQLIKDFNEGKLTRSQINLLKVMMEYKKKMDKKEKQFLPQVWNALIDEIKVARIAGNTMSKAIEIAREELSKKIDAQDVDNAVNAFAEKANITLEKS